MPAWSENFSKAGSTATVHILRIHLTERHLPLILLTIRRLTTIFDSLSYFEKLKAAGVPEEQVEAQAAAFWDFNTLQEEKAKLQFATTADL